MYCFICELMFDSLAAILTPMDEFQYWREVGRPGSSEGERAERYLAILKPISKDYGGLDTLSLHDAMELVEITQDTLDDLWKQNETDHYPEERMRHLMDVIGTT